MKQLAICNPLKSFVRCPCSRFESRKIYGVLIDTHSLGYHFLRGVEINKLSNVLLSITSIGGRSGQFGDRKTDLTAKRNGVGFPTRQLIEIC